MLPSETEAMRNLRLALEGTLRQQAETILLLQAQVDALRQALETERQAKAFWKFEVDRADARLADLRRRLQGREAA